MTNNKEFEKTLINKIIIRLQEELGDIYDDFITEMQYDDVVISGTFILQAYYGEIWDGSDIDIFVHVENNGEEPCGGNEKSSRCCGTTHYQYTDTDNGMKINIQKALFF